MAKRFSFNFKGSGLDTTQGRTQTTTFLLLPDATTDVEALAIGTALATLNNGELVGISKQIMEGDINGPWPLLTANGGSDRAQLLFRSVSRRTESVTLPFLKHNVDKSAIEAVFDDFTPAPVNSAGEALGKIVNIKSLHVIDGA